MIEMLVMNPADDLRIHHIPLRFSTSVSDVGRFRLGTLVELCRVLLHGAYVAVRWRPAVMSYPPSAGSWGLSIRDAMICGLLRPPIGRIVLHCHGLGFETGHQRLDPLTGKLWPWALGGADVCIEPTQAVRVKAAGFKSQDYGAGQYGLEDPRSACSERCEPNAGRETRILYVGNLIPSKGIN